MLAGSSSLHRNRKWHHSSVSETPALSSPSVKIDVCLTSRWHYVTSCSCRAALAPVPGDLCTPGFHSDRRQGRIPPRGWRARSLGLKIKCFSGEELQHGSDAVCFTSQNRDLSVALWRLTWVPGGRSDGVGGAGAGAGGDGAGGVAGLWRQHTLYVTSRVIKVWSPATSPRAKLG